MPAFDFMPTLSNEMTIFMGDADHLAGPDNIKKLEEIVSNNKNLTLHLYKGSDHGFFNDIDSSDDKLTINAKDALDKITNLLFSD